MRISDWSSDVCSSDLIAVELAHDQQVDRRRDFGTQRRAVLQPGEQLGRAQIGEQPESGTQAEDRLLGAQMALDVIEERLAERGEEDGDRKSTCLNSLP